MNLPGRPVGGVERAEARGFTLIEMMVAAALMSLILASAYLCLNAGIAAQRLIDPRIEAAQTGRVILSLLTADLRAACPLSKEAEFVGNDRKIGEVEADGADFGTHNHTPSRPGEGDFCQTSYFVERDPGTGDLVLWRRRNPRIGLDPFTGGARQELARGVRQLKLEYYDGFNWYDSWGDADGRRQARAENSMRQEPNLLGLPTAVRITLALAPPRRGAPSPDTAGASGGTPGSLASGSGAAEDTVLTFQTVVRIEVPSSGLSSPAAGGSSSPEAGGAPGSGAPQPPVGGGS